LPENDLPSWDLSDLYLNVADPNIDADLEAAMEAALHFEKTYRGQISAGGVTAETLTSCITALESVREKEDRVHAYVSLVYAADVKTPEHGALLQRVRERLTDIGEHLLFFDLEWATVSEDQAPRLMKEAPLSTYRHYLEIIRRFAPHQLSEPEEKILEEKANTGIRAFQRLFDETINNIRFHITLDGQIKEMSEQEALALLHDPSPSTRKGAAEGLTDGLKANIPTLTFILNQVAADHASDNRLRRFSDPMAARHLSNEIKPASVTALLTSCERYYPLVQRYYRLKKRRLGLEKLYDYDRYAPPLSSEERHIPFDAAKEMILDAFHRFSPEAETIAATFFKKGWIDAASRPGKQGGAFSHGTVPGAHPYILVNYLGTPRDVMTVAHELGHGIHQTLSGKQSYFNFDTPLTLAETASVFAERLLFHRMQQHEQDPERRLNLIMEKLEEDFSTVFRQVVLCRFEQDIHRVRRDEGELSSERINQLWMKRNQEMFQDSIELTEGYRYWWSYIPHFIHSPFYTYAYAFGHLLVLSLYKKYLEEGQDFVPSYMRLLSSGGSNSPDNLLKDHMNLDITQPDFWSEGLGLLEKTVIEAEKLNERLSPKG